MIEQNKGDVQIIFDSSRFWSSRMVDFKVNWLMTKQIGEAEVRGTGGWAAWVHLPGVRCPVRYPWDPYRNGRFVVDAVGRKRVPILQNIKVENQQHLAGWNSRPSFELFLELANGRRGSQICF